MSMNLNRMVTFTLGGIIFEYDEEKNRKNIQNHGISFKNAARVFFDYDRIEFYDEEHSDEEDRYNIIGDTSAGNILSSNNTISHSSNIVIGNLEQFIGKVNDILFVVYTERARVETNGSKTNITRIISARLATDFERGIYYGKYE